MGPKTVIQIKPKLSLKNVRLRAKCDLEETAEFAGLLMALMAKRRRAVPTTLKKMKERKAVV